MYIITTYLLDNFKLQNGTYNASFSSHRISVDFTKSLRLYFNEKLAFHDDLQVFSTLVDMKRRYLLQNYSWKKEINVLDAWSVNTEHDD